MIGPEVTRDEAVENSDYPLEAAGADFDPEQIRRYARTVVALYDQLNERTTALKFTVAGQGGTADWVAIRLDERDALRSCVERLRKGWESNYDITHWVNSWQETYWNGDRPAERMTPAEQAVMS